MNKDFNFKLIMKIQGSMLLIESIFLLLSLIVSFYYGESLSSTFIVPIAVCIVLGVVGLLLGHNSLARLGKREGALIVTSTWMLFSFIGMLPFLLSGSITGVANAFFETMSGFTTTGASVINNIESLPKSILFWRSMTHWIGGLGIIAISMALLPMFGFAGMQIFSAEATGPTKDKIHPKISETAKRLLLIYIVLTLAETIMLRVAGMGWFDALCHSLSTIATGGFSTKQASIAYYNSPLIEYIIIFFMIFSGVNFALYYFLIKMKFFKIFKNEEFRVFLLIIFIASLLLIFVQLGFSNDFSFSRLEEIVRNSLFITTSTISTTGFVTVDYNTWPVFSWYVVLILMLIGSSAGSTAGGMKIIRVLLVFKYIYYEFKRFVHPNAILPVRYNEHTLFDNVVARILAFIILYFMLVFFGAAILSLSGLGFVESLSGMITCLSDVGPGLGTLGPTSNFYILNDASKWFLSIVMMIGRLEIFTVLLVFTPVFWKK